MEISSFDIRAFNYLRYLKKGLIFFNNLNIHQIKISIQGLMHINEMSTK